VTWKERGRRLVLQSVGKGERGLGRPKGNTKGKFKEKGVSLVEPANVQASKRCTVGTAQHQGERQTKLGMKASVLIRI